MNLRPPPTWVRLDHRQRRVHASLVVAREQLATLDGYDDLGLVAVWQSTVQALEQLAARPPRTKDAP